MHARALQLCVASHAHDPTGHSVPLTTGSTGRAAPWTHLCQALAAFAESFFERSARGGSHLLADRGRGGARRRQVVADDAWEGARAVQLCGRRLHHSASPLL